ncbi:hypothetical protein SprV_0100140200 [Sparganum proliferum]
MVDTGAQISVVPPTAADRRCPSPGLHLQAANCPPISTFGSRSLTLNIGLRRSFSWIFVIADVPHAILGSDFLAEFDLLVDCRRFCLLDRTTGLSVRGLTPFNDSCNLSVLDTGIACPYRDLLLQHPNIIKPQFRSGEIQHDVVHHIRTSGPPVFARPRRLAPSRLQAAKAELEHMLQLGIIRPSESPWASPLHMVSKATSDDWRSCGDYRALNNATIPDRYPVPHLQDFAGALFGKSVFSKIDLVRAFRLPRLDDRIGALGQAIWQTIAVLPFSRMEDYLRGIDASGHGSAILAQLDDDVYDLARAAGISSSMPGTEILKNLRGILCGTTPSWLERSEFRRRTRASGRGTGVPPGSPSPRAPGLPHHEGRGHGADAAGPVRLRCVGPGVTSMEQASNVGDTRKLYQLIRQVSGKPSTLSDSVRDVNGGFIADKSARVERWRGHFEHHRYPTYIVLALLLSGVSSLSYLCSAMRPPPPEGEVADVIRKLRNNKAPGEDGIPAEIFKSCVDTGALAPRLQAVRDSRTRPNQAGFRAGRGCADQIFTLRSILEFRHGYQQPTAVCFVDFAAAFDSVHCESLWRIMALDGVPAKIIAMIKAHYRSTTARVLVRNNLSQPFGIRSGVRQGCILSPILFNYAIDWILGRALRDSDGVEFAPGHRLDDLDYADDIALLATSFGDLQSMVSRVNEVAKSVGLSINAGKTKVFSSCIPDQEKAPLGIDGCQLEEVDSFKYLGTRLLPNGQSKDDIVSRVDAARWVFFKPSEMPVEPT